MAENPIPQGDIQPPMVYVTEVIQWQYRRLITEKPPTEDDLNKFGNDGWELCDIVADGSKFVAYFKRAK